MRSPLALLVVLLLAATASAGWIRLCAESNFRGCGKAFRTRLGPPPPVGLLTGSRGSFSGRKSVRWCTSLLRPRMVSSLQSVGDTCTFYREPRCRGAVAIASLYGASALPPGTVASYRCSKGNAHAKRRRA